ncbi:TorF family putative porin [bacterium]|nr:TorF family putative porin [bacterium]
MKIARLTTALTSIFLTTTMSLNANAVEGLSANVATTNNYLWRGLEQTNGNSAISGGIDYAAKSGFYLGTWVSNAEWAEGMTYELDIYGGFSGETDNFSYDLGFVHYAYPDSTDDVDFTEINASVSFGIFSVGYAVLADAEGVGFGDDSYISAAVEFEVAPEISLALNVGAGTDDFYAGESFVNYGASLSKGGFTFGVSKTDLDEDDAKFFVSYAVDIDL